MENIVCPECKGEVEIIGIDEIDITYQCLECSYTFVEIGYVYSYSVDCMNE